MPDLSPQALLFLLVAGALGAVALCFAWLRGRARAVRYERIDSVLTAAERAFLRPLESAIPPGTMLLMKVRLADFLRVPKALSGRDFWRSFIRISSKHADFLLCDARTLGPLLVIELDDRTHARAERRERDEFVDRACRSAGVPVLRVTWQRGYDRVALREQIEERLRSQTAA